MPEVIEINRIGDLDHYHLAWQSLHARTRGASFFQSLAWLRAFWRYFGEGKTLRVLLVRSGDELIGILPLAVISEPTRAGLVRTLTYPLHDWGSFFGPIGPNPSATLAAGMKHVANSYRDWDLVDLRWVDKSRFDRGRTPVALLGAGLSAREQPWKETALIDLSGTWDDYLASRTIKLRSNIRRLERRFDALADAGYQRYRPLGSAHGDDDPRWDLFDGCVELAGRSWQGTSNVGTTLSHGSVRNFFRETHSLAAKAGALDLNVLTHAGRVIAFGYGYHTRGSVLGLRTGYDLDYAKYGVGQVLKAFTIRDSFERRDELLDVGPGFLESKLPWLTRVATSYRYTHYPLASLRAQALRLKHWLTARQRATI